MVMEKDLSREMMEDWAQMFCSNAVRKWEVQCNVRGISPTRAGALVFFIDSLLTQLIQWVNEFIMHKELFQNTNNLGDMYRYFSVTLLSQTIGFRFERTIDKLRQLGHIPLSLQSMKFMSDKMKTHSHIGRGNEGNLTWIAQRD